MQPFDLTQGDVIIAQGVQANNTDGMTLSVRTDLGNRVTAWRPAPAVTGDGRFFCHGYSLGTYGAHKYSVFGTQMPRVWPTNTNPSGRSGWRSTSLPATSSSGGSAALTRITLLSWRSHI